MRGCCLGSGWGPAMTNKEKRMQRQLRGYAVEHGTKGRATFLASTDALARDGMIIEKDAWQLDNFRKNPVIHTNLHRVTATGAKPERLHN
jgi:hypothetical protein